MEMNMKLPENEELLRNYLERYCKYNNNGELKRIENVRKESIDNELRLDLSLDQNDVNEVITFCRQNRFIVPYEDNPHFEKISDDGLALLKKFEDEKMNKINIVRGFFCR
ncbi:MAG: hypothetical protein II707_02590 [Spirochaetales bacterium]|nr:hypothetical protein [Spirochaetales bacterium]